MKNIANKILSVLLGRAYLYPLLAAGEQGVSHILNLFNQQIREGLAFLGAQSIDDLDPSFVELPAHWRQPANKDIVGKELELIDNNLVLG